MLIREKLPQYFYLLRLHKPIGILLLLWPTLWGLWLATHGHPQPKVAFIFIAGVILMRSAGCAFNDFADRQFDLHVQRTQQRPLATKKIKNWEGLLLAAVLSFIAFMLVVFNCNLLTIHLAAIGAMLTVIYPFLKRITHLPQLGLGMAFAWGIPMVFAAETGMITGSAWFLFFAAVIWPVIYDTMYAMVDRQDDLRIGVKSSAILFGQEDKKIIGLLQIIFLVMLLIVGKIFHLKLSYYGSMLIVGILFLYQQHLIKNRDTEQCFHAFLNNHWVGFFIFLGIYLSEL